MHTSIIFWIVFHIVIGIALFVDLDWFQRKAHAIKMREAIWMSIFWIALALSFNLLVFYEKGSDKALDFFTCYLLEKSLSVDNLFVFLVIFNYFAVPVVYMHKVLYWGVLGAIFMRAFFIFVGIALIEAFSWTLVIMGVILLISGWKLISSHGVEVHPEHNIVMKLFRRFFPVTEGFENGYFFVIQNHKLIFTPLAMVLVMIETTDVMFAFDSIPAVIGITQDPFIVYTSNIFAILGLRSLYFVLVDLAKIFEYIHYGLGGILIFIGLKMILSPWMHFSVGFSLSVIVIILTISIIVSILLGKKKES